MLSKREAEVEALLLAGHMVKEIAHLLGIAHSTVEAHRDRIYIKRGVHSRVDLARAAVIRGEGHMLK